MCKYVCVLVYVYETIACNCNNYQEFYFAYGILQDYLYIDMILVVTELVDHLDKPMVKNIIFNVILPDLTQIIKDAQFIDIVLRKLILKLMSSSIFFKSLE